MGPFITFCTAKLLSQFPVGYKRGDFYEICVAEGGLGRVSLKSNGRYPLIFSKTPWEGPYLFICLFIYSSQFFFKPLSCGKFHTFTKVRRMLCGSRRQLQHLTTLDQSLVIAIPRSFWNKYEIPYHFLHQFFSVLFQGHFNS